MRFISIASYYGTHSQCHPERQRRTSRPCVTCAAFVTFLASLGMTWGMRTHSQNRQHPFRLMLLQDSAHLRSATASRFRVANRHHVQTFLCAQEQTSQHIARSQLDEKLATARQHPLHAIVPATRRCHLVL